MPHIFPEMKDSINESMKEYLGGFEIISLDEVREKAALMKRIDTKFALNTKKLKQILIDCRDHYRIVDIDGNRLLGYETTYFDTDTFAFYHAHQSGRLNRIKVRTRKYVYTDTLFLEVKHRLNKGNTQKIRKALISGETEPLTYLTDPVFEQVGTFLNDPLFEKVRVSYDRITLVSKKDIERVTIDTDLHFSTPEKTVHFPYYAVAEVKQMTRSASFFKNMMKKNQSIDHTLSKYCLGVSHLFDDVKKNRFKDVISKLNKSGFYGIVTGTEECA